MHEYSSWLEKGQNKAKTSQQIACNLSQVFEVEFEFEFCFCKTVKHHAGTRVVWLSLIFAHTRRSDSSNITKICMAALGLSSEDTNQKLA